MEKTQTQELEFTSIGKLLFKFSTPAVIGSLVNATYNIIDRIFIGRAVGELGLAAASISFPIMLALMGIGMLIGFGTNALVSIRLGEKKKDEAERLIGQAVLTFVIVAGIMIAFFIPNMERILTVLGATEAMIPMATGYASIIIWGNLCQHISYGCNSFIRGEGRPKVAMVTMFIGAILNIILDYIFLFVFDMGVDGAALATVIAQSVAAMHVLHYFITGRGILRLRFANLRLRFLSLKMVVSNGAPHFLMHVVASFLQALTNNQLRIYSDNPILAISSMGVIFSIGMLGFMPVIGISQGMQPIIGFNYGARNLDRVKECLLLSMKFASAIVIIYFIIMSVFPHQIFLLFAGDNMEFADVGTYMLRRFSIGFPLIGINIIVSNYFQATGRPKKAIIINILRQVIFLIPLLLLLPLFLGFGGIPFANGIADILASLVAIYFFVKELKYFKACENAEL